MAILNITHIRSLIYAKQTIKNLYRCNRGSIHDKVLKFNIKKLEELQKLLIHLNSEPMFDELQNLDTGGPVSLRKRLGTSLYSINQELSHGHTDAG